MNPRLLVPGTSGCKLLHDGQDIGWPSELTASAWIAGATSFWAALPKAIVPVTADQLVQLLSMEFGAATTPAPSRTTLAGGTMTAGPLIALAYNQLTDCDPFLYDWRSDIRDSAAKLVEHLEGRGPGDPRWRIVAHSQGGLVVVAASKLFAKKHGDDDRAFSGIVSHVALLATPLHGTVNAASALIVGDDLAGDFTVPFRRIVRTWPALHQMLPIWPGCVRRRLPAGGEENAPFDLMDDRAWAGMDVDAGMLERARTTRAELLRAPLSRMNGVQIRIVRTKTLPTRDHVLLTEHGLELAPADVAGDGLVPEQVTFDMGGEVERARSLTFGGGSGKAMQHFALADDPVIATAIRDFLNS